MLYGQLYIGLKNPLRIAMCFHVDTLQPEELSMFGENQRQR